MQQWLKGPPQAVWIDIKPADMRFKSITKYLGGGITLVSPTQFRVADIMWLFHDFARLCTCQQKEIYLDSKMICWEYCDVYSILPRPYEELYKYKGQVWYTILRTLIRDIRDKLSSLVNAAVPKHLRYIDIHRVTQAAAMEEESCELNIAHWQQISKGCAAKTCS